MAVSATPINPTAPTTAAGVANALSSKTSLAKNFDSFLQLLTTQLKNQSPLDPLDTNQFTQQLVQFAQVEQQINMNQQMATLIAVQKATQTSAALGFVGAKVAVDGATSRLQGGQALWTLNPTGNGAAIITIKDLNGQLVHTENRTVRSGPQTFAWNGRDSTGKQLPDGFYTIAVTAKDSLGRSVGVSTEVQGVVDGVDLTQDPPLLAIGSQTFTLDRVKRVVR